MIDTTPRWNTYHPLGMNRIVRFPELYEMRFSIYAPESCAYTQKFYFLEHLGDAGNVLRAGPHTVDCSYASADFSFAGCVFRLEFANSNGNLACCYTPIAVAEPFSLVLIEVVRAWNLDGAVELDQNNIISFPGARGKIKIAAAQGYCSEYNPGAAITFGLYNSEEAYIQSLVESGSLNQSCGTGAIAALAFTARIPVFVSAWQETDSENPLQRQNPSAICEDIARARERCRKSSPAIRGGPFEGCYQAVSSVMNWMTVWDCLHEVPYAPVSRSWIDNYMVRMGFDPSARGPLTGLWDSFFHTILHSVNDRCLAESSLRSVLDDYALLDEGYPPNYMVSTFLSGDRSQPPLGSLAAWKTFRRFDNPDFLEWIFPRLMRWREWWKLRRDGNRDGLLEWGSDGASKKPGNDAGTLFAAKCESGMDNSPLYDYAEYDAASGTMNLSDVGLNSLFAADALFLARIAGVLGKTAEKESLEREYDRLVEKINSTLWNEDLETYMDRFWDGRFSLKLAPMSLYPLMARIPTQQRADTIVRLHLLNDNEFWGEHVIPTISRSDPAFRDQLYWRGRIWPPVNYLVYLGLKNYRLDEAAHQLARRSVRLFMNEWNLRGHCHENYNAITGEADDVPVSASPGSNGSDRFYPWGALLALMGIEELFDVELDSGIRFGCRFLEDEAEILNIPYGGSKYRIITSSARTIACRDDLEFYSSTPGTSVRSFEWKKDHVAFAAAGTGNTNFTISAFEPACPIVIRHQKQVIARTVSDQQGSVAFALDVSGDYIAVSVSAER